MRGTWGWYGAAIGLRQDIAAMLLAVVAGLAVTSRTAAQAADVGSSILVFPYVVADATRDTVIEIFNNGSSRTRVACDYGGDAATLPGQFSLFISRQQPTHWTVSRGRTLDPGDTCIAGGQVTGDCDGAGTDPGTVPAVDSLRGWLFCFEVDPSGAAGLAGNHLVGRATVIDRSGVEVIQSQALAVLGSDPSGTPGALVLDGNEYDTCPARWHFAHPTVGAHETIGGIEATASTSVIALPCDLDLAVRSAPAPVLQVDMFNAFEEHFSTRTPDAPASNTIVLGDSPIFQRGVAGSDYAYSRFSSDSAVMLLGLTTWTSRDGQATAVAMPLHAEGIGPPADVFFPEAPR